MGKMVFSMEVWLYGVEVGFFLCGGVWFFWWFHGTGLRLGFFYGVVYGSSSGSIMWVLGWVFLVGLGLRYRSLWFGVRGGGAWLGNGYGLFLDIIPTVDFY